MNHGLLPWKAKDYVHAFTTNTLMRVVVSDVRQDADRSLTLVPPAVGGPSPDGRVTRMANGRSGCRPTPTTR